MVGLYDFAFIALIKDDATYEGKYVCKKVTIVT